MLFDAIWIGRCICLLELLEQSTTENWLEQEKVMLSQFWTLEVQGQLSAELVPVRENLLHASPRAPGALQGVPWFAELPPCLALVVTWCSLCVHLCPNFPFL